MYITPGPSIHGAYLVQAQPSIRLLPLSQRPVVVMYCMVVMPSTSSVYEPKKVLAFMPPNASRYVELTYGPIFKPQVHALEAIGSPEQ